MKEVVSFWCSRCREDHPGECAEWAAKKGAVTNRTDPWAAITPTLKSSVSLATMSAPRPTTTFAGPAVGSLWEVESCVHGSWVKTWVRSYFKVVAVDSTNNQVYICEIDRGTGTTQSGALGPYAFSCWTPTGGPSQSTLNGTIRFTPYVKP